MIIQKLEVGMIAANCYIVADEEKKEGMIIDPGEEPGVIIKRIEELGLKIKYIVLTHSHPDHIGGIKGVKDATGAHVPRPHRRRKRDDRPAGYRPRRGYVDTANRLS